MNSETITADYIGKRLEEAGHTLRAMPANGPRLGTKSNSALLSSMPELNDGPAMTANRFRPPAPTAAEITRMDATWLWLGLIENRIIRRLVAARSLTRPLTGKPVMSWRKLAVTLGADYRSLQAWHDKGIKTIVRALQDQKSA